MSTPSPYATQATQEPPLALRFQHGQAALVPGQPNTAANAPNA